ncbi:lysine-rich arabinogalactan protein 19 [Arthroderma uncinatum]|uniref:lysine-rich arabinogalactan protein 19 n=1 Tax=Arthroderma uncinatum TaxID=74035 RepID=UPI00144A9C0C|nr:lysine-rich arabinogalactan protein 19 [Arthroderma uncinatum]KAF3492312.1 lysine-rich arabinogalactan protein 19 [Arthroderma uncinatum]
MSQNTGMIVNGGAPKSRAEELMAKHAQDAAHGPTVEDVVDEEDIQHPPPSMTAKAPAPAAAAPATSTTTTAAEPKPVKKPALDVQSEESFPALGGGPKASRPSAVPMAWGSSKPKATAGSAAPNTAAAPPIAPAANGRRPDSTASTAPRTLVIPGKHVDQFRFDSSQMIPRAEMKRPISDILRDISRKSKVRLEVREGAGGVYIFEGVGNVDAVRQALKEVAQQVGSKKSIKVPVPASARPHIIGRQGAVIQGIFDRTGARISVPKPDDSEPLNGEDDEDNTIEIEIEGDALAAEMARREVEARVKERTSNINLRVKTVAPELFPFIAGPHNESISKLEDRTKTQIRIPRYYTWGHRPPPQEPTTATGAIAYTPDPDQHILIVGERVAAQEARSQIERRAQELQRQITLRHLAINRGQHQFILGDKGDSLHDFLASTGCAIVLPPPSDDTEFLTVTGPAEHIDAGINRAMDLATSMQMANIDVSRQHPNAPCGSDVHARALTAYLQERRVIEHLEKMHDSHIVLPLSTANTNAPITWEVYSRNGKNTILARSDIMNLIQALPPSKLATVPIDPYLHGYLRSRGVPKLKEEYGVHLVVPECVGASDRPVEVVLAYEGPEEVNAQSPCLRRRPSSEEAAVFQKALREATEYLRSVLGDPSDVTAESVPIPVKYHDKLRRFVTQDQTSRGETHIPVSLALNDGNASFRGRSADVSDLISKLATFVADQERDDRERNHVTTFDFPQKYANFLIGKRGENINKLREEFDVDIKVENGKVDIKGPPAKGEAAKARIIALAKKLEDEATYVLKIAPQYHRDLIGQKGSQVNRLQERYNVRVQFPRANNNAVSDDVSVADGSEAAGPTNGNGNGNGNARSRPAQAADEVIVRGPKKGADSTRDEILSLYQWLVDHSHSAVVSVARDQIPSLIGQRGREMDKFRAETGAQIDIPGPEAGEGDARVEIRVKGTKKQVEDAKKLLLARAREFDETITRTVEVDKKHHKALIGGGGANIRKLIVECGGPDDSTASRIVKFPRAESEETTIKLEGKEVVVTNLINAIEEFVRQKEDQVTASLDVPQAQHRLLIGRGGDTRRQLEAQFNVILDVPKQGSTRTDVKIKGPSASVEEAKTHIQSMLKDQQGETVEVPRHLHHIISDNGAFFRQLRNNHQVTVDHAGHKIPTRPSPAASESRNDSGSLPLITDSADTPIDTFSWKIVEPNTTAPSDSTTEPTTIPWVLSGSPEAVTKAKSLLNAAIQSASQPSCTGYLILPDPKTYRFVVGTGGSQINAIRARTGCRINVPKGQSSSEAIEIKGSKDNLEVAKEMILEAVKAGSAGGGSRRA